MVLENVRNICCFNFISLSVLNSDTSTNPLFKSTKSLEYFQEMENCSTWEFCVLIFGVARHLQTIFLLPGQNINSIHRLSNFFPPEERK